MNHYDQADVYTKQLAGEGVRLLNFWRTADTETGHALKMLELLDLPAGASIADLGSGTGEFARLCLKERPDLQFTLVNNNEWQLEQSPDECVRVKSDMTMTGMSAGAFDAVLIAYSIGHAPLASVLEEAHRLLPIGGKLLVHDVFSGAESKRAQFKQQLCYELTDTNAFLLAAAIVGFEFVGRMSDDHLAPGETVAGVSAAGLLDGVDHGVFMFIKSDRAHALNGKKTALSFGGGKDSLALLYAMRPWWDRLTVYWLNPGNPFPETVELMSRVRDMVPKFKEVPGRQREIIEADGWPSDVVPQRYTTDGLAIFGPGPFKVQSRLQCCIRSIMQPMYEAMVSDEITLCLRGKREEEADKSAVHSGYVTEDGMTVVFPILSWNSDQVLHYLASLEVDLPPTYALATHSLDCMDCTAWWGEGLSTYLRAYHPDEFKEYKRRVWLIKEAIEAQMNDCEV